MAIRNIIPDTDEILHKKCRPVEKIDDRIKTLVADMYETLENAGGVGLAAPQVGVLKRIFVLSLEESNEKLEFINPEIISEDSEQEGSEACLSIKNYEGFVVRPLNVTIKAQNLDGEEFTYEGTELTARALCHENDHLNGITIKQRALYEVQPED